MAAGDLCELEDVKDWLDLADRTITAISQGNPGVVQCPAHNFRNGQRLYFSNVVGMIELNGKTVRIIVLNANSFSIGVDTTLYHAFSSGFIGPDDNLLAGLITRASEDIRNETNRIFDAADYTEIRSGVGWGQALFIPRQTPIISVKSVSVYGRDIPPIPANSPEGTAGFGFTDDHIYLVGYEFTKGTDNIVVVYHAGFSVYPPDLIGACIELVSYRFKGKGRIGEASKGVAGQTTSYQTDHLPDAVARVVQRYRRVIPV